MRFLQLFTLFMLTVYIGKADMSATSIDGVIIPLPALQQKKDSTLLMQQKNLIVLDFVLSYGGFVGLQYERSLTNIVSAELGVVPTYFKNSGTIIPVGLNIFLPFGDKHRVGTTLRLLFHSGGLPTSVERESKLLITRISIEETPVPSFGFYYQFKSDYSLMYRFGLGVVGVAEVIPVVEFKVGYIF
ncbi:MAG: hypothetical protein PHP42_09705 [Bacteroidota bacterium]|nr:hypothetical protein [Bacteroidota bacterium]